MKFIGIIPARYASSRFPGKPLAIIHGKPMIQHVYENAKQAIENVWVATDDERIYNAVENFGGKVLYTSPDHKSGTDRCAEAAKKISKSHTFDVVINIQGDEPFLKPHHLEGLKQCFAPETQIATLVKNAVHLKEVFDPNKPKVVLDSQGTALYFSRSPIPFIRGVEKTEWLAQHKFWMHVGIYAYKAKILQEITQLQPSKLELAESLEQLRWLENGYSIKTTTTDYESFGIDTPEDLDKALQLFP